MNARRSWTVWGLAVLAYVVAVFDRSSLGVAGILAQQRFAASAAALSLLAVLQLAVYAAMQVPVGLLLDRLGSRRMIAIGALVMAAGQLALAVSTSLPAAIGARVLVGLGDAMTFISVLRLVPLWFPPRRVPVVTQLTGILGQLGQIAAAFPLVALLRGVGWTPAYAGSAAVSALVAVLVVAALRDAPGTAPPQRWAQVRAELRNAWREPGTRLGLWSHFVTPFSALTFAMLWGYPYLVTAQGLAPEAAGVLLSLMVLVSIGVGPVLGGLTGQWPLRRSALVFAIVGASAIAWAVVLAWPGRAPLVVLVGLAVVLGSNGPGSLIAFDYVRTTNPAGRLGSANGIVNVGGFVATLTAILLVGAVLDVTGSFRLAFATQYLLWAVGLAGVIHNRRIVRRQMRERDGIVIDPLYRALLRRFNTPR